VELQKCANDEGCAHSFSQQLRDTDSIRLSRCTLGHFWALFGWVCFFVIIIIIYVFFHLLFCCRLFEDGQSRSSLQCLRAVLCYVCDRLCVQWSFLLSRAFSQSLATVAQIWAATAAASTQLIHDQVFCHLFDVRHTGFLEAHDECFPAWLQIYGPSEEDAFTYTPGVNSGIRAAPVRHFGSPDASRHAASFCTSVSCTVIGRNQS
jgi:hypothetical protein